MQDAAIFLTLAQLALTLAGFATIATVLSHVGAKDPPKLQAVRLTQMLNHSFLLLAASLLPFLVLQTGLSDSVSWRAASAIAFAGSAALAPFSLRYMFSVQNTLRHRRIYSVLGAAFGTGYAAMFLTGALSGEAFGWYLAGVCFILALASLNLLLIIYSLPVFDAMTQQPGGGAPG